MPYLDEAIIVVRSLVLSYVRRRRIPYTLWNDAVQEACLRMLSVLPDYDPKKGELGTFLYQPTIGAVIDSLRHSEGYSRTKGKRSFVSIEERRENSGSDFLDRPTTDPEENPEERFMRDVEYPRLATLAMMDLPQREKQVIHLFFWSEQRLTDIGPVVGVSPTRVYQLKTRALQNMRHAVATVN